MKKEDNENLEPSGAMDEGAMEDMPIHNERHALQSMAKAHAMKMPHPKRMKLHARIKKKFPHMYMPVQGQFPQPAPEPAGAQ